VSYNDGIIDNARVYCDHDGHVYYNEQRVQFPKSLRDPGKEYICQLSPVYDYDGELKYYRARKGKIREEKIETIRVRTIRSVG